MHSDVSALMCEYDTPEDVFREALESLLAQSFRDFEILIVDDSLDQHLLRYIAPYEDSRIVPIANGRNIGFVASLNRGIHSTNAKWILRMDTDDVCRKDRLEKQLGFSREHPKNVAIGSCAVEFGDGRLYGVSGHPGSLNAKTLADGLTPLHSSMLIRADALNAVGGYPNYERAEDVALWFELLMANGEIYVMKETLIARRLNSSDLKKRSLGTRKDELRMRKHYYEMLGFKREYQVRLIKSIAAGVAPRILMAARHRWGASRARKSGMWAESECEWYKPLVHGSTEL